MTSQAPESRAPAAHASTVPLLTFAWIALRLGALGFGGSYAVIGYLSRTFVDARRWISADEFVESTGVATALPGTAATNLITMLGYRFGGVRGAVVGATCFLLPSAALMVAFGAAYDHLTGVRAIAVFFSGMSVAAVGVIAAVALDMRRTAVRRPVEYLLAIGAATLLSLHLVTLLEAVLVAGAIGALAFAPDRRALEVRGADRFPPSSSRLSRVALPVLLGLGSATLIGQLFFVFGRIGVATFGGGFAMIPSIEHEVVVVRGWIDERAFGDAIVLGQITPGPVAIAATFIGYRVAKLAGAVVATVAMFGGPFLLCVVAARSLGAFRSSRRVQGFLNGVAPTVVGVVAAACVSLARASIRDWQGGLVATLAFGLLAVRPKLSPLIPIFGGACVAFVAHTWFG